MRIPFERLAPATLRSLIRDFVTRDGTDYGEHESSLETKIAQVYSQLQSGRIGIVFESESESFDILTREEIAKRES